MKQNGKRWLLILLALLVVGGLILVGPGMRAESAGPPNAGNGQKPLLVEVEAVGRGDIAQRLELSGEMVAVGDVTIAATKEGPIGFCPWREGDAVRAGEKLVVIDREIHRAEVQAAEAALTVARAKLADLKAGARPEEIDRSAAAVRRWEATLEQARANLERQEQMISKDFTSQQSVDQARETAAVAEAELAAARETLRMMKAGPTQTALAVHSALVDEAASRLSLAKAHLAECVIAAPFGGIISAVHVRPGDLATPRAPLLQMYDPASLVIRFSVPEAHATAVKPGNRLQVTLDAHPGRAFSAEVVRVYPSLDATLRTRSVEARLTEQAEIAPHMFARLSLELREAADAVLLPAEAVMGAPSGEHFVFVVDQGKARRRGVRLGIEQDAAVQALEGVKPGESVVIAGQAALRDGQPVRLPGQSPAAGQPSAGREESPAGRDEGKARQ